MADNDIFGGSF